MQGGGASRPLHLNLLFLARKAQDMNPLKGCAVFRTAMSLVSQFCFQSLRSRRDSSLLQPRTSLPVWRLVLAGVNAGAASVWSCVGLADFTDGTCPEGPLAVEPRHVVAEFRQDTNLYVADSATDNEF